MAKKFSLRSFLSDTKVDFMGIHRVVIAISIASIIISFVLLFTRGLNYGIDFAGGILIEARTSEKIDVAKVRAVLDPKEFGEITIQNFETNDVIIKAAAAKGKEQGATVKKIQEALNQNFPGIQYRKVDFVGPQVGSELILNGFLAFFMSCLFIMIYIWVRFDWQFGLGAVAALFHDAVLTIGFYSVTGLEFNLTSIAAVLTVIGYSINDSVVIYDRIRENLRRYKKMDLAELLNSSINSTLSRTILTSSTTLVALISLILFGGEVLKSFSIATFFGIVVGTYSSIYISAPILIYMDPRKKDKKDD